MIDTLSMARQDGEDMHIMCQGEDYNITNCSSNCNVQGIDSLYNRAMNKDTNGLIRGLKFGIPIALILWAMLVYGFMLICAALDNV